MADFLDRFESDRRQRSQESAAACRAPANRCEPATPPRDSPREVPKPRDPTLTAWDQLGLSTGARAGIPGPLPRDVDPGKVRRAFDSARGVWRWVAAVFLAEYGAIQPSWASVARRLEQIRTELVERLAAVGLGDEICGYTFEVESGEVDPTAPPSASIRVPTGPEVARALARMSRIEK